ncbi:TPA: phospholipase D family protein [Vibrio diabolicus]
MPVNLIQSEQLANELKVSFDTANKITIISAYLTQPAVEFLFDSAPLGVDINVVCRARPQDFIAGSCDLQALRILHYSGVKCYISRDLHAKLYIIDESIGFIGSANFTSNGLKLSGYGNLELATRVDLNDKDISLITQIRNDAVPVTSALLKQLEAYLSQADKADEQLAHEWWDDLFELSLYDFKDGLYIMDLPWSTPDESSYLADSESFLHDQDIFSLGMPKQRTRLAFLNSKVFHFIQQKLLQEESKEAYFGMVTSWVHDALKDDVLPYRREIKDYIANLFDYFQLYASDKFEIDRPNYSQRITLISHE